MYVWLGAVREVACGVGVCSHINCIVPFLSDLQHLEQVGVAGHAFLDSVDTDDLVSGFAPAVVNEIAHK